MSGLVFTSVDGGWRVLDLTYGCVLGVFKKVEGPGWILDDIQTTFLDPGQMAVMKEFGTRQDEK